MLTILTQYIDNFEHFQGLGSNGRGRDCINVHFLKPPSLFLSDSSASAAMPDQAQYKFRTRTNQHLPTKLAQHIVENYSDFLKLPPKAGRTWTVAELDKVLRENVVESKAGGHLRTFTTVEFEHENYQGTYTARCYPFGKVHGKQVQVIATISILAQYQHNVVIQC